jgi:hypothetical protein
MADIVVAGDQGYNAVVYSPPPVSFVVSGALQGPQGPDGPTGAGVKFGGHTDEFLAKASDANNDTIWRTPFSTYIGRRITQLGHGFVVGQVLFFNGTSYALSLAVNNASAEAIGMVAQVIDSGTFFLVSEGYVTGLSGFSPGVIGFVSDTVSGAITYTEPTLRGHVSKPVFTADSPTSGYFHNYRGRVIE